MTILAIAAPFLDDRNLANLCQGFFIEALASSGGYCYNIAISSIEKILNEAKELLHTRTKRDTIETALKEVIKQIRRKKTIENCGRIELDLNQNDLEAYREKG